jgi:hypothetical protein
MIKPSSRHRPLAYSSPEAVQTTGTIAVVPSFITIVAMPVGLLGFLYVLQIVDFTGILGPLTVVAGDYQLSLKASHCQLSDDKKSVYAFAAITAEGSKRFFIPVRDFVIRGNGLISDAGESDLPGRAIQASEGLVVAERDKTAVVRLQSRIGKEAATDAPKLNENGPVLECEVGLRKNPSEYIEANGSAWKAYIDDKLPSGEKYYYTDRYQTIQ